MDITLMQLANIIAMAGFAGHSIAAKHTKFAALFALILGVQVVAVIGGGLAV